MPSCPTEIALFYAVEVLAVGHVEEAQDEEGGQQVDKPIHLAELAAQNLQQAVRRDYLSPFGLGLVVGALPPPLRRQYGTVRRKEL